MTEQEVERGSSGGKARGEYKKAAEELERRNELSVTAILIDISHIKQVTVSKWDNANIPMTIRQKWRQLARMAAEMERATRELAKYERITTSSCFIIDGGKLREATSDEILRAIDNIE